MGKRTIAVHDILRSHLDKQTLRRIIFVIQIGYLCCYTHLTAFSSGKEEKLMETARLYSDILIKNRAV